MTAHIFINKGQEFVRINLEDIVCIEKAEEGVAMTLVNGACACEHSLDELEKLLEEDKFCRVSDACIVAMAHVVSISADIITLVKNKKVSFWAGYRPCLEFSINEFNTSLS